jgi:hypothetical protein
LVRDRKFSTKDVSKYLDIPLKNLLRWLELGHERKKGNPLIKRRRKKNLRSNDGKKAFLLVPRLII